MDDAKKDLLKVLGIISALFILWIFLADTEKEQPLIKTMDGAETIKGSENDVPKNQPEIYLKSVSNARKSNVQEEYIEIMADSQNKESVNISSWSLGNQNGIKINLGQAVKIYHSGQVNYKQDIILAPGEKVIVVSGQSPLGTNFQVNKCSGYLGELQNFIPKLSSDCPEIFDPNRIPIGIDDDCIKYLERNARNCQTYYSFPPELSGACVDYLNRKANYESCVTNHQNDPDFLNPEYRIYLNQVQEIWNDENNKIILYGQNGKTIDSRAY